MSDDSTSTTNSVKEEETKPNTTKKIIEVRPLTTDATSNAKIAINAHIKAICERQITQGELRKTDIAEMETCLKMLAMINTLNGETSNIFDDLSVDEIVNLSKAAINKITKKEPQ